LLAAPRFPIYLCCTLLAILTSWYLGKEMQWDTLDYHLYAGFSAIHDRFSLDYFGAGVQSYFNPYAYAPFYLLATSGLTAFEVATIFAVIHSAILWLGYELAVAVAPWSEPRTRVAMGVCAVVLVFLNPVLIDQFGSSYADITTAELVLAGCLFLCRAFRAPGAWRIVSSGALLGAASALKLSNGLAAASLMIVPLFLAEGWRRRVGYAALLGSCIGASFVLVSAPWSIQLMRHFGNPLFPMLNNVFHSQYYTTGPNTDSLFIPATVSAALSRPFAMIAPVRRLHYEQPAPDLRYAILLVLGALVLMSWLMSRFGRKWFKATLALPGPDARPLLALSCAFLINWVVWLSVSGNSRYFLPTACLAAVLVVGTLFRLLARWPRARTCVVVVVLVAQFHAVASGAVFRAALPWNKGPWFDVSMPAELASKPALYFSRGIQANAFVVPFLAPGSGFINLDGGWILGPDGANGARIRALIERFSPRMRVLVADPAVHADRDVSIPHRVDVDDGLEPFGLRVDEGHCATIVAPYAPKVEVVTFGHTIPPLPVSQWYTRYLIACQVVPDGAGFGVVPPSERAANLALDRLEDECPAVLEPRRSETFLLNGPDNKGMWVRRYGNTHVSAWVSAGQVRFQAMVGRDSIHDLGSVDEWENAPPQIVCGRQPDGLFFVRVGSAR